jgi:YesN/AraC family two-component response regulator
LRKNGIFGQVIRLNFLFFRLLRLRIQINKVLAPPLKFPLSRENPELHVIEIGLNVGFENTGYFGRKFKEIIGITPIEYLKKQRD